MPISLPTVSGGFNQSKNMYPVVMISDRRNNYIVQYLLT